MILFLTGKHEDLAPDLLFNGFVELLGHDKIIDFPYAAYRHKKTINGYGRNFFCITMDKDVENRNIYNFEDIKQLINKDVFDMAIVSNRAINIFSRLIDKTLKFPRTIIVNGEDNSDSSLKGITSLSSYTNREYGNLDKILSLSANYQKYIDLILQRDYKYNKIYDGKVIPYNFSCPINILPKFDFKRYRDIDVFAQFPITHSFRRKVIEKIKRIKGIKTNVGHGGLTIPEYFKIMNNSKISISITGAGWDTPHYLEIPFMKSMLLAQHPTNAMNPDMTENPVIFINNFLDKYSAILQNRFKRYRRIDKILFR